MKTVYCVLSVGSCENPVFLIVHTCNKQLKLLKEVGMVVGWWCNYKYAYKNLSWDDKHWLVTAWKRCSLRCLFSKFIIPTHTLVCIRIEVIAPPFLLLSTILIVLLS